jgi:hypothetical protein
VERPFNRRDISIRNEITEFSTKIENLRFAICTECSDTEIGVRNVRCVEWNGRSVYTPRYLNQERNNRVLGEILKFAFCDLQRLFSR